MLFPQPCAADLLSERFRLCCSKRERFGSVAESLDSEGSTLTASHTAPVGARDGLPSPCVAAPDRWLEGGDAPELKALCRGCPRRWQCAKDALQTPAAEGMWAAVYIPSEGRRARTSALRQLRSLAEHADNIGAATRQ
jgi:WhiB family redox-sensing transcriptional regulator